MSKVVVLKMSDGSELIATQGADSIGVTTYSKVRVFHLTQQGAGLIPWIMCAPDAEVEIIDGIVVMIAAPLEIEKQYLAATSSIQLLS